MGDIEAPRYVVAPPRTTIEQPEVEPLCPNCGDLTAKLERFQRRCKVLEEHLRWVADTVHRTWHHENGQDRKIWREDCPKTICQGTRLLFPEDCHPTGDGLRAEIKCDGCGITLSRVGEVHAIYMGTHDAPELCGRGRAMPELSPSGE